MFAGLHYGEPQHLQANVMQVWHERSNPHLVMTDRRTKVAAERETESLKNTSGILEASSVLPIILFAKINMIFLLKTLARESRIVPEVTEAKNIDVLDREDLNKTSTQKCQTESCGEKHEQHRCPLHTTFEEISSRRAGGTYLGGRLEIDI